MLPVQGGGTLNSEIQAFLPIQKGSLLCDSTWSEKKKKKIPLSVCFSIVKLHFISKLPMFLFLQNVNVLIVVCVLSKINWPSGL